MVPMVATAALVSEGRGASVVMLARRPERDDLPPGGEDDPAA